MASKLEQMVQARPEGKRCAIFKKTSTAKDTKALRRYIASYLDETGKSYSPTQKFNYTQPGMQAKMAQRHKAATILRPGVDYLTKQGKGDLKAYGFIREDIERLSGKQFHQLSNAERADYCEQVWSQRVADKKLTKVAHKLVVALDPELCEIMREANLPVDEELTAIVRNALRRYQEKFYPGEKLGYMVGIHHDRKHIHAHILLYPQTASGRPINISTSSKVVMPDGTIRRVDFQGELRTKIEHDAMALFRDKIKYPVQTVGYDFDAAAQERILSKLAMEGWEKERERLKAGGVNPTTLEKFTWVSQARQLLASMEPTKLREVLVRGYQQESEGFDSLTKTEAKEQLAILERNQQEIKRELARLFARPSRFAELKAIRTENSAVRNDYFKARKLLAGWRRIDWACPIQVAEPGRLWLHQRAAVNDQLGRIISATLNLLSEKHARFGYNPKGLARLVITQAMQGQLEKLRKLEEQRHQENKSKIASIKLQKKQEREQLQAMRIALDVVTLNILIAKAKIAGKTPFFLTQFQGYSLTGTPLPLHIRQKPKDNKEMERRINVATRQREQESTPISMEELMEISDLTENKSGEGMETVAEPTSNQEEVSLLQKGSELEGEVPLVAPLQLASGSELLEGIEERQPVADLMGAEEAAILDLLRMPDNPTVKRLYRPILLRDPLNDMDMLGA
jgi:hypothetical protein